MSKVVSEALFLSLFLLGHVLIVVGKPLGELMFNGGVNVVVFQNRFIPAIPTVIGTVALFMGFRWCCNGWREVFLYGTALAFVSAFLIQAVDQIDSALIFVLQIYLWAVFVAITILEKMTLETESQEATKMIIEGWWKSTRYILVIYAAGLAIVEYISKDLNESKIGYVTTLAYPTIVMIYGLAVSAFWVLLPRIAKLLAAAAANDTSQNGPK